MVITGLVGRLEALTMLADQPHTSQFIGPLTLHFWFLTGELGAPQVRQPAGVRLLRRHGETIPLLPTTPSCHAWVPIHRVFWEETGRLLRRCKTRRRCKRGPGCACHPLPLIIHHQPRGTVHSHEHLTRLTSCWGRQVMIHREAGAGQWHTIHRYASTEQQSFNSVCWVSRRGANRHHLSA
jgi:hypothetical protein